MKMKNPKTSRRRPSHEEAAWQLIWTDEIQKRVREGRNKAGWPEDGWDGTLDGKLVRIITGPEFSKIKQDFIDFAMSKLPWEEHISKDHLKRLLDIHFMYGTHKPHFLKAEDLSPKGLTDPFTADLSPFETVLILNGERIRATSAEPEKLEDGVYIKIPATASIPAIHHYIDEREVRIADYQRRVADRKGVIPSIELPHKENLERDFKFKELMKNSKQYYEEKLREKFKYKVDAVAAYAHKFLGYKTIGGDGVKQAIKRLKDLERSFRKKHTP